VSAKLSSGDEFGDERRELLSISVVVKGLYKIGPSNLEITLSNLEITVYHLETTAVHYDITASSLEIVARHR
jgi:hypothetical protein